MTGPIPRPERPVPAPHERGADPDPAALLTLAREAAATAAALLRLDRLRSELLIERKSSSTDMVTEVDRAVERLIIDAIVAARPDDAVLGEEGGGRPGSSGVRWVIDPIDGTTNFVYGIPAFAVSIAAELHGRTVAGVVHIPSLDEVYEATLGGGARCNGLPIGVSGERDLSAALVATGFSYQPARRGEQGRVVAELLPAVRDIRRMGAASVDLCAVACGRVDVYYESGLHPWDYGAGSLVATEAGAIVTDLWGGQPTSRFLVAATPGLHAGALELLLASGAAQGTD